MISHYIQWNPNPELINLFGVSIRYYGLLFVIGLVLSVYIVGKIFEKENIPEKNVETIGIYGIIGIFGVARLAHCIFYEPSYYLYHPIEIVLPIKYIAGVGFTYTGFIGFASHGGALGMFLALVLYSRKTKHSFIDVLDLISIAAPLAGAFIRIANLMNSEIIGIKTSMPWAFVFQRVDSFPRHPAQLYEAISYFLIFGIMITLYKKKRDSLKNGFFFGLALALTFTARFFIEFVKEKQVAFEESMKFDMGQLLSLPYIVIGIGFIVYGIKKTRKDKTI